MKITITLNDMNALGKAWEEVKDKTYGKQTTAVYQGLRPFLELADDYRKARQNYIKEHAGENGRIERFEPMEDQDSKEMSDEVKEQLGIPETEEWKELQTFLSDLMYEEHTFDVKPILDQKQQEKLTPNQLRVFDVFGLLVLPKEPDEEEE